MHVIKNWIRQSVAMIADVSESRRSVKYKTGFAHALGVSTVYRLYVLQPDNALPDWKSVYSLDGPSRVFRTAALILTHAFCESTQCCALTLTDISVMTCCGTRLPRTRQPCGAWYYYVKKN